MIEYRKTPGVHSRAVAFALIRSVPPRHPRSTVLPDIAAMSRLWSQAMLGHLEVGLLSFNSLQIEGRLLPETTGITSAAHGLRPERGETEIFPAFKLVEVLALTE